MSPNTPEAWPPPPTLPPPAQEQNVRWKLPLTLPADRNWLVSFDDAEIVFSSPRNQRILGATLCVLGLLCAVLALRGAAYNLRQDGLQQVTDWYIFIGCSVAGLSLAAPNSLTLNLRERTYRFRYVPLLVPKVVTGPLTDIASLTLSSIGGKPVGPYTVQLKWTEKVAKSRPRPTLGQYSNKPADAAAARTLMRRVAAKLDVPCAYPYLFHIKYPETLD